MRTKSDIKLWKSGAWRSLRKAKVYKAGAWRDFYAVRAAGDWNRIGLVPSRYGRFSKNGTQTNLNTGVPRCGNVAWSWSGTSDIVMCVCFFDTLGGWGDNVVLRGTRDTGQSGVTGSEKDLYICFIDYPPELWSQTSGVSYNYVLNAVTSADRVLTFPASAAMQPNIALNITGAYAGENRRTLVCYNPAITTQYRQASLMVSEIDSDG